MDLSIYKIFSRYIYENELKKIFVVFSIFSLALGIVKLYPVSAKEPDIDQIYEEEISKSIISGDESEEYPYIIDEKKVPMFSCYLEEKGKSAIASLQGLNHVEYNTSYQGKWYGQIIQRQRTCFTLWNMVVYEGK